MSQSNGEAAIDLGSGVTKFLYQGKNFQIDLSGAYEDFEVMRGETPDLYHRVTRIQEWAKQKCSVEMSREGAENFELVVVKRYHEIKKKQLSELAAILGSQPSTDSGPADSPGSTDSA